MSKSVRTFAPMWQRRQTLFLALAVALAGLMYLFPLIRYERLGSEGYNELRLYGLFNEQGGRLEPGPSIPLQWLTALLIGQLFVAAILFRDRTRQLRITRLAFLFTLGLIVGIVFTNNSVSSAMGTVTTVTASLQWPAYLPMLILVLIILAERGIRKDEALVRSADRLR